MYLERKNQLLIRSPEKLSTSRVANDVLSAVNIRFGRASGCMEDDVQKETRKELAAKATLWTWKDHEALKNLEHRKTRVEAASDWKWVRVQAETQLQSVQGWKFNVRS